ncbi:MAG: LPS biosynthesis protein WbpP, partial [Thaumarchaeota archaeon]|nr:LPS biosynthesis protein WbpP [Nitrososphaerota archaeon]
EGDIKHSQTKIDKAQRELNFNPKVKLEEGLKQLLEV